MANRRMFSILVVGTDYFNDMPATSRLLYYELGMMTDDDGFVSSPKKVMKATGATDGDLAELVQKGFVILFETGVVVVTHHRVNNYLQNDRTKKTQYQHEVGQLTINPLGIYERRIQDCESSYTEHNITEHKKYIVGQSPDGDLLPFPAVEPEPNPPGPISGLPTKKEIDQIADDAVSHLNTILGSRFQPNAAKREMIRRVFRMAKARKETFPTLADYKAMIDHKVREWSGTDMEKYLRPETLFRPSHFDGYLEDARNATTATAANCPVCGGVMDGGRCLTYGCDGVGVVHG